MLTIPLCLDVLGGLQRTDPALRWRDSDGFEASWHPRDSSDRSWPEAAHRLIVEQSEPALLRVLARHLGWEGAHRLVMTIAPHRETHAHRWTLRTFTNRGEAPDDDFVSHLPLGPVWLDLDYHDALAEAVVWYARIARAVGRIGYPLDGGFVKRWNIEHDTMWSMLIEDGTQAHLLASIEERLDLPTWAVQR